MILSWATSIIKSASTSKQPAVLCKACCDLLYKRAKEVLPEVLQRVSERIHVPYQKCEIVKSLRACAAYNQGRGRLIAGLTVQRSDSEAF